MTPSPFRYPGGKTRESVRRRIFKLFPDDFSQFREPFVGGGGIFFAVDTKIPRWINDYNENLISVYLALRDNPADFIRRCKAIEAQKEGEEKVFPTQNSTGKKYNKRLKDQFDLLAKDSSADKALRYLFINRTVWAGRVNYDAPSRLYFSNPEGWNIVKTDRLERAAEHLKNTKITCTDFSELLLEPGNDVLIYCDPPYMKDTELPSMSKLYRFGFSLEDHRRFAKAALECEHNLCISYDDHPKIRELFSDQKFCIHEEEWTYSGSSQAKKTVGRELIITNYKKKSPKKKKMIYMEAD